MNSSDVTIIGAGPVGLFAVFTLGMLGMRCQVVDVLDELGGQCTALYPEKPIYDIPGYPEIAAGELIGRLGEKIAPFRPAFHLGQQIVAVKKDHAHWIAFTSKGLEIKSKAIVIAAGVGAFGPNRPPLDRLEEFEGQSVFYTVRRIQDFAGKRVVIAGGGDSAVDWALSLAEVAKRVIVVHRRAKFKAAPENQYRLSELAKRGVIDLEIPYQLAGLEGEDGILTTVIAASLDGNQVRIQADILLPFFGLAMKLGPIADWGLNLDRNHLVVDPATGATNRPGIYAIGDIAQYPGKLKLILTGFAEAAVAARAIHPLVFPDRELHVEYS
ncbi:MAG: NAD(P)/FAD-dependent oxidoreductase, partial [Proteobacteria bacterium]|nr:NAD(P)/FAD-dependent oxidoreductase [Pseudomonadota bacterium]